MSSVHPQPLLSAYLDGEVTPAERSVVESHLTTCPDCRAVLAEYRRIGTSVREMPRLTPPRTVRSAVLTGIQRRQGSAGMGPAISGVLRLGAIGAVVLLLAFGLWNVVRPQPSGPLTADLIDPRPSTQGVPTNADVWIRFSKAMPTQSNNISGTLITVDPNTTDWSPSWQDATTLVLSPLSQWLPGTTYTVTALAGASAADGSKLTTNESWVFTTSQAQEPTSTPTNSPTATDTPVAPTATITVPVQLPLATNTPAPQPTDTPEPQPTDTSEPQPTDTPQPAPSDTPAPTATPLPTVTTAPGLPTVTQRPTLTAAPPTATRTAQRATATRSATPQATHSAVVTATPLDETATPAPSETATPAPSETSVPEPTKTRVPTRTATSTRSATPAATLTPEPTASPEPSHTPEPTITPTSGPTSTPTPGLLVTPVVTPGAYQACGVTMRSGFGRLYQASSHVAAALGCPKDGEFGPQAAEENFQSGYMFWRADTKRIYALFNKSKAWQAFPDTYQEGDPANSGLTPPAGGLYEPVRGFGNVWREQPGVRDNLGWATNTEQLVAAAWQDFDGGFMLWTQDNSIRVLYSNGAWEEYQDVP